MICLDERGPVAAKAAPAPGSWAEDALNHLATYYIQQDQDDDADAVLRDLYARFPRGRYAERAAWKVGWRAYRAGNMGDTDLLPSCSDDVVPWSDSRKIWPSVIEIIVDVT